MQELGNFVTDVSLIPYIRPQALRIFCRGMKANTQFHAFFDGENMNDYCTLYDIPGNGDIDEATVSGTEGDALRSNAFGELLISLRLPSNDKRFRVGTKDIKLTDSPTDAVDASSYAEGAFHAQGLKQDKQNTILSTSFIDTRTETRTQTKRTKQISEVVGPSCMAYSFLVEAPEDEEGVFLTSTDVFIQSLHPTLGVWFELREMDNVGGITRNQVPYSEVWMKRDDPRLQTSNDASLATNINFPSPVFLYNNVQYAFIIHTEGLNPDTYFFVSRLGEDDIRTNDQITSRKLTGTIYTTNNNLNWDQVPDLDLTVTFYRANFTGSNGQVVLGNDDLEYISLPELPGVFFNEGDTILGSEYVGLSGASVSNINSGYFIIGDSSGVTGEIVSIDTGTFYTDAYGFEDGETVTVVDDVGTPTVQLAATITSITSGKAKLRTISERYNRFTMYASNGEFFVGSVLRNLSDTISYTITAFDSYFYSLVRHNPGSLSFKATNVSSEFKGKLSTNNTDTLYESIEDKGDSTLNSVMALRSASVQTGSSYNIRTSLSSSSNYVSPVIDNSISNTILVRNIINSDISDEDNESGGELINTYISKIVTLTQGYDAQDLNVFLTTYKPPNTDVIVWAKMRNRNDPEFIEEKPWIELENTDTRFSSIINTNDFIEHRYTIPDALLTGSEGEYEYTVDSDTFSGFTQFDIKIGLLGDENEILVPRVGDLRSIAMQM
jgi:hypothetical protein